MATKSKDMGNLLPISSIFSLGHKKQKFSLTPVFSQHYLDGKPVSIESFDSRQKKNIEEDEVEDEESFKIVLTGIYCASDCISNKKSKITSTIEFHPKGCENDPVYLYLSVVEENEDTGLITYTVKSGKRTMGNNHTKVFER